MGHHGGWSALFIYPVVLFAGPDNLTLGAVRNEENFLAVAAGLYMYLIWEWESNKNEVELSLLSCVCMERRMRFL